MFTVLCCADISGEKVNLEITLDHPPNDVDHLEYHLARIFTLEAGYSVNVACLYIYDDLRFMWVKLDTIGQLYEYDQLYLFQPQGTHHEDRQQDLPPPRPPRSSRAAWAVAENQRRNSSLSLPPSISRPALQEASSGSGNYTGSLLASSKTPIDLSLRLERLKREKEMLLQRNPTGDTTSLDTHPGRVISAPSSIPRRAL